MYVYTTYNYNLYNLLSNCNFKNPKHIFLKLSYSFNVQLLQLKIKNTLAKRDAQIMQKKTQHDIIIVYCRD